MRNTQLTALNLLDLINKPLTGPDFCSRCSKAMRSADNILDSLYQNFHGEKLHTKFCKYVLGVHSKASNLACVGEVGRFPIYIDFCNDILKYYFYASQKTNDSLIGQYLWVSKNLYQTGVKSWYTGVNTILKELNLNETNCDQAKFSLINMYKTFWRNKLENEVVLKKGKLRTFYSFK